MLKIGEFSKLMKVSIRMLRYYDEIGLLKPAMVNEQTGYRLYSNKEVEKLNKIIYFRDLGFGVEEIKSLLITEDEQLIGKRFSEKEKEIQTKIMLAQRKLVALRRAQEDYKQGLQHLGERIVLKEVPDYWVISYRKVVPDYYAEAELWHDLCELVQKEKITLPIESLSFAIYHDGEYKEHGVDIEVCSVIDAPISCEGELTCRKVAGCKEMATLMVYGPFENIAPSYQGFVKWLEQHSQYHIMGCDRQISHRGPWNETDEKQYLVELQIPVASVIDK